MKCHLCCREKKLIKAHVIPEKFFTPLRSEKKSPILCSNFYGINFYRFYMTGFVIYIKVDKRETPQFLKNFYIRENQPICILLRDLHNSKDGK